MFKWVIYFMFFCSLAVSGQTIKIFNSENLLPIKLTSIFVKNKEYKTNEKAEVVIEKKTIIMIFINLDYKVICPLL